MSMLGLRLYCTGRERWKEWQGHERNHAEKSDNIRGRGGVKEVGDNLRRRK